MSRSKDGGDHTEKTLSRAIQHITQCLQWLGGVPVKTLLLAGSCCLPPSVPLLWSNLTLNSKSVTRSYRSIVIHTLLLQQSPFSSRSFDFEHLPHHRMILGQIQRSVLSSLQLRLANVSQRCGNVPRYISDSASPCCQLAALPRQPRDHCRRPTSVQRTKAIGQQVSEGSERVHTSECIALTSTRRSASSA